MTNKAIFHTLCACMLGMAITSCSEDVKPYGEEFSGSFYLSVDKRHLSYDINRTATVRINSMAEAEWEIWDYPEWINIDTYWGKGPQTITITATGDNPYETKRSGSIHLHSSRFDRYVDIDVEQEGTYLSPSVSEVDFLTAGGSQSLTIETNSNWHIKSLPSWLTASPMTGEPGSTNVTLTATANPSGSKRSGSIIIRNRDESISTGSANIPVEQAEVRLSVTSTLSFTSPASDTKTVNVTSNSDWTVSSSASWCTVSKTTGSGNGSFTVTVSEWTDSYQRTAYIYVTSGNVTRTITVTQDGIQLSISIGNSGYFKPDGEYWNLSIQTNANTQWKASVNQTWVHFGYSTGSQSVSGTGSTSSQRVTVDSWGGSYKRTATITVTAGSISRTTTITQGYYSKYSDWTSTNKAHNTTDPKQYTLSNIKAGDILTFSYDVSSEKNYDKFTARILKNGSTAATLVDGASGTISGQAVSYTFNGSGTYTLSVAYVKDHNVSSGSDQAHVYNVKVEHK